MGLSFRVFRERLRTFKPPRFGDEGVCACGRPAVEVHYSGMCADTSPRKGTWTGVCAECDLRLNELTLKILYGDTPEVDAMVEAYRQEKAFPAPSSDRSSG